LLLLARTQSNQSSIGAGGFMLMPFQILGMWLRGLLSVALLAGGISLLVLWYNHREQQVTVSAPAPAENPHEPPRHEVRTVSWQFGLNKETAFLLGGIALLAWSLTGQWTLSPRLWRRPGNDEPRTDPVGQSHTVHSEGGESIHVETFGPEDGQPIVFVHGWGLDRNEWYYAKKSLGKTHRLILWDLPGLGQSERPTSRDWSLEKLATDLHRVIAIAGPRPVVLAGHSIGGMIILTYCRLFPQSLTSQVKALVLAHTTYTNPVETTKRAGLYRALQKPVLEPLCHLMVWLSPVVSAMNWLSYLNGSAHRATERDSFSGEETRGQLDFITKYYSFAPPDVIARGMLAMFRYDATSTLRTVQVPVLVVAGDADSTCLPEASAVMASTIPHAKRITLANAKHCGLFEHHVAFHEAVTKFLVEEGPRIASEALPLQQSAS
jgi:pimeloyl-ACP methyl ester carboxylesterase